MAIDVTKNHVWYDKKATLFKPPIEIFSSAKLSKPNMLVETNALLYDFNDLFTRPFPGAMLVKFPGCIPSLPGTNSKMLQGLHGPNLDAVWKTGPDRVETDDVFFLMF